MVFFAISGPVHTYSYIFENEEFFLFSKRNIRPHGAYLNRFRPSTSTMEIDGIPNRPCALWCMKSSYSKTVSRRFQKLDSGDRFRKLAFLAPENAAYVRKHISVFENIRMPLDRALETGLKIAVLFTPLIWKKYQLKTEFQKNAKNQAYLWLNVVYFWGWKIVFVERYLKEMRI